MLTDLTFLEQGQPWPPHSELERLNRYQRNRHLFNGDHEKVFRGWTRIIRHDDAAAIEQILNFPKRLSTLWADLLFGEPPRFTASAMRDVRPEPLDDGRFVLKKTPEQETIERLVENNNLIATAYQIQLDDSRYGDGLYTISLDDGESRIEAQPPEHWFPIVEPDNAKRVQMHVLAWIVKRTKQTFLTSERIEEAFLRVQIHERGRIENRLYRLGEASKQARQVGPQLALSTWDNNIPDTIPTGIDEFLVVHVPNLQTTDSIFGLDDYKDLYTLVEGMAIRLAQNDHILDKHADPSMHGPPGAVTVDHKGDHIFMAGGRYIEVAEDESPPNYLTWEGNLAASFQQMEEMQRKFYILSETSPAAFGQMDRVIAESGTALRRLMMVPLAKVNRTRLFVDPALKQVLSTAAALERAANRRTPLLDDIDIEWHDGLPDDPKELAEIEELRHRAENTSVHSSVARLDGGTEDSVLEEMERIRTERAADAGTDGFPPLNLDFGGTEDES